MALLAGYALSANRAIDASAAASDANPCQAIRDARTATDRMPWSARSWQTLAGASINAGQLQAARDAYARALQQAPTDFRLWYAAGAVQDPALAAASFARARQLNPHLKPDGAIEPVDPADFPPVPC
jgi:tetratricopeptide (TPR) repeat protein